MWCSVGAIRPGPPDHISQCFRKMYKVPPFISSLWVSYMLIWDYHLSCFAVYRLFLGNSLIWMYRLGGAGSARIFKNSYCTPSSPSSLQFLGILSRGCGIICLFINLINIRVNFTFFDCVGVVPTSIVSSKMLFTIRSDPHYPLLRLRKYCATLPTVAPCLPEPLRPPGVFVCNPNYNFLR